MTMMLPPVVAYLDQVLAYCALVWHAQICEIVTDSDSQNIFYVRRRNWDNIFYSNVQTQEGQQLAQGVVLEHLESLFFSSHFFICGSLRLAGLPITSGW